MDGRTEQNRSVRDEKDEAEAAGLTDCPYSTGPSNQCTLSGDGQGISLLSTQSDALKSHLINPIAELSQLGEVGHGARQSVQRRQTRLLLGRDPREAPADAVHVPGHGEHSFSGLDVVFVSHRQCRRLFFFFRLSLARFRIGDGE